MRISLIACAPLLLTLYSSAQILQSYIDLEQQILTCPPIKHKMSPDIAGSRVISLHFEPFQIASVDEMRQAVTLSTMLKFAWKYPACGWKSENYSGIQSMEFKKEDMWNPNILTPKSVGEKTIVMPDRFTMWPSGILSAQLVTDHETACYLNLYEYPYDEHNCTVPFLEMSGLDLLERDINYLHADLNQYFGTSAEWILQEYGCSLIYETNKNSLNYTECWFTMKRRSIFYVSTLIFPVAAMCTTTLLVFCIPAESGEKMSFLISLFVSMTVFINFIVDVIPRSMDQLPKLVWLILAVMCIMGAVTTVTALILRKYHREEEEEDKKRKDTAQMKSQTDQAYHNQLYEDDPYDLQSISNGPTVSQHDSFKHTKPPNVDTRDALAINNTQPYSKAGNFIKCGRSNRVTDGNQENQQKISTRGTCWNIFMLNHRQLDNLCFLFFLFVSCVISIFIVVY